MKKIAAFALFLLFSVAAFAQTATQPRPIETLLVYNSSSTESSNVGSAVEAMINQNPRYRVAHASTDAETIVLSLNCSDLQNNANENIGEACAMNISVEYPDIMHYNADLTIVFGPREDYVEKSIYNDFINNTNDEVMNKARSSWGAALHDLKKFFASATTPGAQS